MYYRISSNKCPLRLLNFWNYEVWGLLEAGAYFRVREMSNIKCQNLIFFSFKIKMKILSINQIWWKNQISNILIVLLFVY